MHVEMSGSGPPLVAVHGLGGTTAFYDPLLAALTPHFSFIRYDFNGHGRTPLTTPLTIRTLTDDLAHVIQTYGNGRAFVIAHSMGTLAALRVAAEAAGTVPALVLLAPVGPPTASARRDLLDRAATARKSGMRAVADGIVEATTSPRARAANPMLSGFIRDLLLGQNSTGYAQACQARLACGEIDLTSVRCPTLVVRGDADPVSTPAACGRIVNSIAHATGAQIADCGHWTVPEAPKATLATVLPFLQHILTDRGVGPDGRHRAR